MIPTHHKLQGRIILDLKITNNSPLHIGSGDNESTFGGRGNVGSILTYLVDSVSHPFIPGSSFKGVIRSAVERFLRSSKNFFSCDPLNNGCHTHFGDIAKFSTEKILKQLQLRTKKSEKGLCLSCIMFGSQTMKSIISVSDFMPKESITIGIKTSTSISRTNGSVAGRLFMHEYVSPNHDFYGKIIINSGNADILGYISAALHQFNLGNLTLGAFSSKGFGSVDLTVIQEIRPDPEDVYKSITLEIEDTEEYLLSNIAKIGEGLW